MVVREKIVYIDKPVENVTVEAVAPVYSVPLVRDTSAPLHTAAVGIQKAVGAEEYPE